MAITISENTTERRIILESDRIVSDTRVMTARFSAYETLAFRNAHIHLAEMDEYGAPKQLELTVEQMEQLVTEWQAWKAEQAARLEAQEAERDAVPDDLPW